MDDETERAEVGSSGSLLLDGLAGGHAEPVVQAGHIDLVTRVDDDVDRGVAESLRVRAGDRLLPLLRVGDEHLEDVDAEVRRGGQRVVILRK